MQEEEKIINVEEEMDKQYMDKQQLIFLEYTYKEYHRKNIDEPNRQIKILQQFLWFAVIIMTAQFSLFWKFFDALRNANLTNIAETELLYLLALVIFSLLFSVFSVYYCLHIFILALPQLSKKIKSKNVENAPFPHIDFSNETSEPLLTWVSKVLSDLNKAIKICNVYIENTENALDKSAKLLKKSMILGFLGSGLSIITILSITSSFQKIV